VYGEVKEMPMMVLKVRDIVGIGERSVAGMEDNGRVLKKKGGDAGAEWVQAELWWAPYIARKGSSARGEGGKWFREKGTRTNPKCSRQDSIMDGKIGEGGLTNRAHERWSEKGPRKKRIGGKSRAGGKIETPKKLRCQG